MSYEICTKCKMPVGEWNETRRRERFQAAVAAMQGILADSGKSYAPMTFAKQAVAYADALLAELEREAE